jgi:hypothetical protein
VKGKKEESLIIENQEQEAVIAMQEETITPSKIVTAAQHMTPEKLRYPKPMANKSFRIPRCTSQQEM